MKRFFINIALFTVFVSYIAVMMSIRHNTGEAIHPVLLAISVLALLGTLLVANNLIHYVSSGITRRRYHMNNIDCKSTKNRRTLGE